MTTSGDTSSKLAIWADTLRSTAQTGLAFDPHPFDRERYERLLHLAAEMAATVNDQATLNPALAAELESHWRAQVRDGITGYVTPKVGVGAVVFNERDELLLIKRPDSGRWLYPTGWLDVGDTPAQTAVKEVEEETGFIVEAEELLGVFDGNLRNYTLPFHMVSVMVYCRLVGGELRPHPLETAGVGFFPYERLPDPLHMEGGWVEDVFRFHKRERGPILE